MKVKENKNNDEKELVEEILKEETEVSQVELPEEVVPDTAPEIVENVETVLPADDSMASVEESGEATFDKKTNKKLIFIATVIAVIAVGGALFAKNMGLFVPSVSYTNTANGYSYKYPQELQLVAEGSIPEELAKQGVTSMAQLNLTAGDSLLIKNTGDKAKGEQGDNIVYTVLELSSRANFVDFESYKKALFANLDEQKQSRAIDYAVKDSNVGNGIVSVEYTFEMEVPVDQDGKTRTGVFYDNVFQTKDGRAYSISYGYPKDAVQPESFMKIYRGILSSFRAGDVPMLPKTETADIPTSVIDGQSKEATTTTKPN